MKILHIVGDTFDFKNGIAIISHELTEELSRKGIQAEILLLRPTVAKSTYPIHQNIDDFRIFFENQNYDLAVFHGVYRYNFTKIAKQLRKRKITYLIRPHSSLMKASFRKSWLKKRIGLLTFFRAFIKYSYAIVFSNEEEHLNSILRSKKYFIEQNGIKLEKVDLLRFKPKVEYTDIIELLFLSRIDFSHKGIDFLVKGFEKFKLKRESKNVHLSIYGKGSTKDELKLKKLIKDIPDIGFYGPAFGKEKDELLSRTDILMLTSRYEGFPTILIDVLSKGIPVIITPGTNAGYFQNEGVGWLADLTADSIAETIERAIYDYKDNKQEIIERCINFAFQNFDITKNIENSIELYSEVIQNTNENPK